METRLDPRSGIPLYLQLAERLLELIRRERLVPGARLPSEHQLVARFGVSRATVRQALQRLAGDGLIDRTQGRGTFVVAAPAVSSGGPGDGLVLFAHYAYPPNQRGYCGPDDHRALLEYGAAGVGDPGLEQLARAFAGPWPYLDLIARTAGIDPFDRRVVESYWIGNDLLERVDPALFAATLRDRFRHRIGASLDYLSEAVPAGAVPHHNFHVFEVYPWVGLLDSGRGEPLEVLDRCRIRWGRVEGLEGDRVTVRGRPLVWNGKRLRLGAPQQETATRAVDGMGFAADLAPGDWVGLHWDWVCGRLTARQLTGLRRYTLRQLAVTNRKLGHPGPAMVLG